MREGEVPQYSREGREGSEGDRRRTKEKKRGRMIKDGRERGEVGRLLVKGRCSK